MNRPSGSRLTYDMGEIARNEVCLAGFCVPEATVQAAAVFAFGVVTLLVLVGLAHVYEAEEALTEERERVAAERDAFRRFAARVERIGPSVGATSAANDAPVTVRTKPPDVRTGPPDAGVGTVAEAYRETVMSIEHFDDEYGEELVTNAAAELSPEVAAALASDNAFTPQLRSALVTQSQEAAASRKRLLDAIDAETEAVLTAADDLAAVESAVGSLDDTSFLPHSYAELEDTYDRVGELRGEVGDVVEKRQETLHEGTVGPNRMDGFDFRRYVYGGLNVQFPVLADATALLERLDDVESQVVRSLLRRA